MKQNNMGLDITYIQTGPKGTKIHKIPWLIKMWIVYDKDLCFPMPLVDWMDQAVSIIEDLDGRELFSSTIIQQDKLFHG